jgi:hypothetical protein
MPPTYHQEHRWPSALPPEQAVAGAAALGGHRGIKVVRRGPGGVELKTGSRFAFRMLGAMLAAGRRRLPIAFTVDARPGPGGGSEVRLRISDDMGPNLVVLRGLTDEPYAEAMARLTAQVRQATTG